MPENIHPDYDFRLQRLYIDHPISNDLRYTCSSAQANYLLNVLRLKSDEIIYVFNGKDGEWSAQVEPIKRKECKLKILNKVRDQGSSQDIEYLFAPLKRSRLDYMIQKAVELGVSRLRPVFTSRTIMKRVNLERMQANVIEAAEQCGVLFLPKVSEPENLKKIISDWPEERNLIFCDERAQIKSPIDALSSKTSQPVSVLVGPEGGFDQEEQDLLRNQPFVTPVSLGPRIMRADTAAVAILSLVNATIGDWQ